nr:uncharacterized protein LOC109152802 isoform X2 [Ipomoea batatas]GME00344.1 uncharacterized protein LOC109152802 isoform X2 [Ipomoea batatas]
MIQLRSSSKKSDGKKPTKETGKGNSVSDNNKSDGKKPTKEPGKGNAVSDNNKSDGKKPTKEMGKGNSVSDNNKESGSRKRKIDKVQEKPKPSNKSAKTSTGKSSATSQKVKEKANLRPEKTKKGKNNQKPGSTSKKTPLKSPKRMFRAAAVSKFCLRAFATRDALDAAQVCQSWVALSFMDKIYRPFASKLYLFGFKGESKVEGVLLKMPPGRIVCTSSSMDISFTSSADARVDQRGIREEDHLRNGRRGIVLGFGCSWTGLAYLDFLDHHCIAYSERRPEVDLVVLAN